MLKCSNLSKSFGQKKVLSGLSLELGRGQKVLISGENGCGKSTLAKLLLGVLSADTGFFECTGTIGWMPSQSESFFPELTGRENLYTFGSFNLVDRSAVDRCITEFSAILSNEILDKRVKTFSSGMLQKLNLVRAFLHRPDILILDEPLAHIDQSSCQFITDKLSSYQGIVMVMSHLEDLWDDKTFKHLKFETLNAQ